MGADEEKVLQFDESRVLVEVKGVAIFEREAGGSDVFLEEVFLEDDHGLRGMGISVTIG